jgi:hypothetical protein
LNIRHAEEYARNLKESLLFSEQGNDYEQFLEKIAQDNFEVRLTGTIDELPAQCKEIFMLSRYHKPDIR